MRMRIMFIKMKKWLACYPLVAAALLLAAGAQAQETAPDTGAKQLWQLIDYVAVDYGGAVEHGKVVSEAEYAEMLDFTDNAATQIPALPAHASKAAIAAAIAELRAAVVAKADGAQVKRLAHQANGLLIAAYPIPVAPKALPNLARGAAQGGVVDTDGDVLWLPVHPVGVKVVGEVGDGPAGADHLSALLHAAEIVRITLWTMQCHVVLSSRVDDLHEIDLAATRPADLVHVGTQHPKRRPDALPGRKFDAGGYRPVQHGQLASGDRPGRRVSGRRGTRLDHQMAVPVQADVFR